MNFSRSLTKIHKEREMNLQPQVHDENNKFKITNNVGKRYTPSKDMHFNKFIQNLSDE